MNMLKNIIWLQITTGQGPRECGWVVAQVYQKIQQAAENKQINIQIVDYLPYEKVLRNQNMIEIDAYKSILLGVEGVSADTFATEWQGTVKWQGRSHYRPKHKRRNWFIGINMISLPEDSQIEIKHLQQEVVVEVMHASGPGGQHVNKTNSAVRIKHIPAGITRNLNEPGMANEANKVKPVTQ